MTPRIPKPSSAPTLPAVKAAPEEVSVGTFTVPKTRVGMAKYAVTKVDEIGKRLAGIHEEVARTGYEKWKRIEVNDFITGTGLRKTHIGGPRNGSMWVIHRVILALGGDASDSPSVNAFPAFYKDRNRADVTNLPNPSDIVLPLLLPGVVGTSVVTTGIVFDLNAPCVYRGIEALGLWVNYSGTITKRTAVYVGLDVEILSESPTGLEVS